MSAPTVSGVRITGAMRRDRDTGLVAFVSATIAGALVIDGLVVRRTRRGEYTLSWPERRDRQGLGHPYYLPASAEIERAIEDAVLAALLEQSGTDPEGGAER